jgi:hypothetical protein
MLKRLCVLCVGLSLCLGIVGCGEKPVEVPKDNQLPTQQPVEKSMTKMAPKPK